MIPHVSSYISCCWRGEKSTEIVGACCCKIFL